MTKASKIFCSYSHKDEKALGELRRHLAPLRRRGIVEDWHDRDIPVGGLWDKTIKKKLYSADIILLLISSDFINSDYCMNLETAGAITQSDQGKAIVIPIFLRECVVEELSFSKLQGVPSDKKWINQQKDKDKSWAEVVLAISKAAEREKNITLKTELLTSKALPKTSSKKTISLFILLCVTLALLALYTFPYLLSKPGQNLLQQGEYKLAKVECLNSRPSLGREKCLVITDLMLKERKPEQLYNLLNNEDSIYARLVLAESQASREDFSNAINNYLYVIKTDPTIAQAYFGMGHPSSTLHP